MSDKPFDMPPAPAGYPARGRWLIDRLMAELSLSENQAAGIVGNLGFESGGLTVLHEVGQPAGLGGYGWAQWTGPRRRQFFTWCDAQRLSYFSDEANYGFLLHELTGDYAYAVDTLRKAVALEAAVFFFGKRYEAPGGTTTTHLPGYAGRLERAKEALAGERTETALAAKERPKPAPASSAAPTAKIAPAASAAPFTAQGDAEDPSDIEAEELNSEELARLGGAGQSTEGE